MTVHVQASPAVPTRAIPLRMSERRTLLALGDAALLALAVVAALWLWTERGDLEFSVAFVASHWRWFVILGGLWGLTAALANFYRPDITASFPATALALLRITASMLVIYFLIYFVSPPNSLNRVVVIFFGVLSLALIGAWRGVYALLLHRAVFEQRVLILGAGPSGQVIARAIQDGLDRTYRVMGFVDDGPTADGVAPVLGDSHDLVRLARQYGITEIVLAVPEMSSGALFQSLLDCQEQGIQITPMALLYENITGRVPVEHVGDQWYVVLPLDHQGNSLVYSAIKRLFDLALSSVVLAVYLVWLPFLALAIKLDSKGSVFYTQQRVGKGGRVFAVYKLRSMVADAERDHAVWCAPDDPRVTHVGRFLRRTRLDEFPQLWNIWKGDMSFVGPRPERPELVAELEKSIPFYRARHAVRPGATGWAFVHSGYARSVGETMVKLQYDLYYIKHQSLWLDAVIVLKSVGMMLTMRGT